MGAISKYNKPKLPKGLSMSVQKSLIFSMSVYRRLKFIDTLLLHTWLTLGLRLINSTFWNLLNN